MKFNARNGDRGIVRDANGHILPNPVEVDTETGIALCFCNSTFVTKHFAAPLTVSMFPADGRVPDGPIAKEIKEIK